MVVVGAGPAGSVAGALLAREGFRVAIVERCKLPRSKPCGGGLTLKSGRLLEELGLSLSELPIERYIDRVVVRGWDRSVEISYSPWIIATVERSRFDYELASWAESEGAALIDGTSVTGVASEGDLLRVTTNCSEAYEAAWVVGADGGNSVVGKSTGLRRGYSREELILATESKPPAKWNYALFQMDAVPVGGYGWLFPLSDRVNVGVGGVLSHISDLLGMLARHIRSLDLREGPIECGFIPIGGKRELFKGNVLLVGDAAGLGDPLTGEGIYQAIFSGRAAARAISMGESSLYAREMDPLLDDLALRLKAARVVLPRLRRFFEYMASEPEIAHRYTLANLGEISFSDFWKWVWRRVPLAAAKKALRSLRVKASHKTSE